MSIFTLLFYDNISRKEKELTEHMGVPEELCRHTDRDKWLPFHNSFTLPEGRGVDVFLARNSSEFELLPA